MKHLLTALFVLILVVPATADTADEVRARLDIDGEARVTEVIDGDTVVLDNGRQVRLVGIQAPKLPLGRPGFEKWPLADAAKSALEDLVLGKTVTLGYGGLRTDRYNRLLAHLFLPDGAWVQGRLLEDGMARGQTFLNFGEDWRTDFTISIAARDWKRFEAEGISPEDFRGRKVRVRGWLRSRNGPMINATHAEQIEVLSP